MRNAPGMDHINAVLKRNADDLILSEICSDGGEALANLVGFVGLEGGMRGTCC